MRFGNFVLVGEGRGTITVIKEKRGSFDVKCGDVFRIPSGAPFYFINKDEHQKLKIVKLLQTTSVPGRFEVKPSNFYYKGTFEIFVI